jgi:RNA polymerase sigma factor (sigma-70 family)
MIDRDEKISTIVEECYPDNLTRIAAALYDSYHLLVKYFLGVFGIPAEDQQDLLNSIFLRVIKGLGEIKHFENLKSWVVTIAKNEIFTYLNRREREKQVYCAATDEVVTFVPENDERFSEISPEQEILKDQLRAAFKEIVAKLDDDTRAPFLLRYREGMRWQDIGRTLGLNLDTARKRADKGKRTVVRFLRKRFGRGGSNKEPGK